MRPIAYLPSILVIIFICSCGMYASAPPVLNSSGVVEEVVDIYMSHKSVYGTAVRLGPEEFEVRARRIERISWSRSSRMFTRPVSKRITSVAVSPNDATIAWMTDDGLITVEKMRNDGFDGLYHSIGGKGQLHFLSSGVLRAVSDNNVVVTEIDLDVKRSTPTFRAPGSNSANPVISQNGSRIAYTVASRNLIRVHSLIEIGVQRDFPFGSGGAYALSGDGALLAVESIDGVEVYDIASGDLVHVASKVRVPFVFMPDDSHLVYGDENGGIMAYSLADSVSRQILQPLNFAAPSKEIIFSSDGSGDVLAIIRSVELTEPIASGEIATVHNPESGFLKAKVPGRHIGAITKILFTDVPEAHAPDDLLATVGEDMMLVTYERGKWQSEQHISSGLQGTAIMTEFGFRSPTIIFPTVDSSLVEYDLETFEEIYKDSSYVPLGADMYISQRGQLFASVYDSTVDVYSYWRTDEQNWVKAFSFKADSKILRIEFDEWVINTMHVVTADMKISTYRVDQPLPLIPNRVREIPAVQDTATRLWDLTSDGNNVIIGNGLRGGSIWGLEWEPRLLYTLNEDWYVTEAIFIENGFSCAVAVQYIDNPDSATVFVVDTGDDVVQCRKDFSVRITALAFSEGHLMAGDHNGTLYRYRVCRDMDPYTPVDVAEPAVIQASADAIQCFPNPLNGRAYVRYRIENPGRVQLTVVDQFGAPVAVLVNRWSMVGSHSVSFAAQALPTGVFFLRLETDGKIFNRPIIKLH